MWARLLEKVQSLAHQSGDLDWVASIDSTIVRVHQHGTTRPRTTGALSNYKKFGLAAIERCENTAVFR